MDPREKDLVERVLNGDLAAFEPLVLPYRNPLLGLAYRMTRNAEDAQEVAQDAFLRAFKYLRNFDVERSFKNWLYQILVHSARHFRNKRVREEQALASGPVRETARNAPAGPERGHEQRVMRARLMNCLDVLTPREREVFLLRDIEDLNIQESAKVLGCSAVSVRVHLSAARKKIRERIKAQYPDLLGATNVLPKN
jgi:RNA polymerase sigma-70 factor (ECF subfamily)